MSSILIQNAAIIGSGQIAPQAGKVVSIAIEDGVIVYVGDQKTARSSIKQNNFRVIDASGKLVLPGLVNAHTHVSMSLLRGYYDDLPLQKWLFDYVFPAEDKMNPEIAYWSAMLGIAEMIKSGITAFADMYFFMDQAAEAVKKSGIKANLARGLQCFDENYDIDYDVRFREAAELFEKYNGEANGRIKVFFGPHSVYTCIPDYLKESGNLARKYNSGIHIHLSENVDEVNECKARYGKSPILHAAELGIFENKTVLAAHCVVTDDEDIECLYENDVIVVHNPGSNLKLGSGIAPISKYKSKGIRLTIGTDGASSNNNLDMFEEIRFASLLQKGILQDSTAISAIEAIYMATEAGAAALGFNNSGKIENGFAADLILVDFDKLHLTPVTDYASHIAYAAASSDVDTVIVDGNILMEDRVLTTIDEDEVKRKAKECALKILG